MFQVNSQVHVWTLKQLYLAAIIPPSAPGFQWYKVDLEPIWSFNSLISRCRFSTKFTLLLPSFRCSSTGKNTVCATKMEFHTKNTSKDFDLIWQTQTCWSLILASDNSGTMFCTKRRGYVSLLSYLATGFNCKYLRLFHPNSEHTKISLSCITASNWIEDEIEVQESLLTEYKPLLRCTAAGCDDIRELMSSLISHITEVEEKNKQSDWGFTLHHFSCQMSWFKWISQIFAVAV